jgi:hypothetical protein
VRDWVAAQLATAPHPPPAALAAHGAGAGGMGMGMGMPALPRWAHNQRAAPFQGAPRSLAEPPGAVAEQRALMAAARARFEADTQACAPFALQTLARTPPFGAATAVTLKKR